MPPALRVIPLVTVGAALTFVHPPLAAQGAADSATAIVQAFHDALAAGDSARALALLAPDVVIFESGGVEASREEYRSHHLAADTRFAMATRRQVTNQRAGAAGDVAWVLTETRSTGSYRDRPVDTAGVETVLLRRSAGGWRIAHIHWSSRATRTSGG